MPFFLLRRARDSATGADVAVKICKRVARGRDVAAFLREEFRLQTAVVHPHVLPAHRIAEGDDDSIALVMPVVGDGGADLAARMDELDRTEPSVATMAAQLLSALTCLHAKGIVHRDVKLENVLVGEVRPGIASHRRSNA